VKTYALVPLNALNAAKSRLADALTDADREALALWMASHVLDALLASRNIAAVAVVTPDPMVLAWASRRGALALQQRLGGISPAQGESLHESLDESLHESLDESLDESLHESLKSLPGSASIETSVPMGRAPALQSRKRQNQEGLSRSSEGRDEALPPADESLNKGLELGRRWALAAGADALLVALGDLPCLTTHEVDTMIALANHPTGEAAVILAPDRRERGTNALLVRPPWLVRFTFGAGSLTRHGALARYTAVEPVFFRTPGAAFDVDTPADLSELAARGLWSPGDGPKAVASASGKEGPP